MFKKILNLNCSAVHPDLSLKCLIRIFLAHLDSSAEHLLIILNPTRVTETRM